MIKTVGPNFTDRMNEVCRKAELYDKSVSADPAVEANRQALLDRSNVGIAKYGTTLMDNKGNLRYWLNHALEECLDQANYLRRAIMEIDGKLPIPEGVYFYNDNFYSGLTLHGMGQEFWDNWKDRKAEFPNRSKYEA